MPADATFVIERVAHGTTEDPTWRQRYNEDLRRGVPVGFYAVPETGDTAGQARFVAGLIGGIAHTMGFWWDLAIGDGVDHLLSDGFVDGLRAGCEGGVYTNGAGMALMPAYARFERLWYAGPNPPPRWLMRQPGPLDQGNDIDLAADIGVGVRAGWTSFTFPNP